MTYSKDRFLRVFLPIAGSLPWLVLYLFSQLWGLLRVQVGLARAVGTFELFTLVGLMVALLATTAALLVKADHPRLTRWWRTGFFALAAVNGALVGLALFYNSAALAPLVQKGLAGAIVLVLVVVFARYGETDQAFVTRVLQGLGVGVMGLLLAASPWILVASAKDRGRLPSATSPVSADAVRSTAPKRVILVSFDGLRARSTSLTNPAAQTPNLAALARHSTWFSQCRAASDATLSSMTAILTGTPPDEVFPLLENSTGFLRQGILTGMGGHLAPAGYRSYFATMLVNPQSFGLQKEFVDGRQRAGIFPLTNDLNSHEFLPWRRSLAWLAQKTLRRSEPKVALPGGPDAVEKTVDLGLSYLRKSQGRTFLWLHLATPHAPLYEVDFSAARPRVRPSPAIDFYDVGKSTPETAPKYEAMYEAYARYADSELGRFLAALQAEGLWDDTLLVVTADHGEQFVPGLLSHGTGFLPEEVTHVPLLVHRPGQTAGARIDRLAAHTDILPTVLDAVYTKLPEGIVGERLDAALSPTRMVFTWGLARRYFTTLASAETMAAYRWPYKFLMGFHNHPDALYDLSKDPDTQHNVLSAHPEVARDLRSEIQKTIRMDHP